RGHKMNTVQKENQTGTQETRNEEYVAPEVNIFETAEGYVLEVDMPGVNKDGVEITIEDNDVTIVGRRQPEAVTGETLFRERRLADYRRAFELDPAIDTEKVTAKVEQGVLTLTLPKSERVKPRKISVN